MLKVEKKLNNSTTIVAEGQNHSELFASLSSLQETFGEEKCGKCGCENLKFQVRKVVDKKKEYVYHELWCTNLKCKARLNFGQRMDTQELYPKRYDMDGDKKVWKKDNGWVRWNPQTNEEE